MGWKGKLREIAEGRFLRFVACDGWEFAQRKKVSGIVVIVAITAGSELVLVEQFRPPLGKEVIELPAGLAGDSPASESEDLLSAAKRELIEETGHAASHWEPLARGVVSAGITDEVLDLYFASGAIKVGPGGGDETEKIAVHVIPLAQVPQWLKRKQEEGKLIDLKIYAGLNFINLKGQHC
jgi:ADP-ribose pyrophosphatase